MQIRPFRAGDAPALVELARECARGEADFVLNPLWESEEELEAEFARFGIDPAEHLLVADEGDGDPLGMVGYLREPATALAGMIVPVVRRSERGRGLGGQLLRGALGAATERLGIEVVTAGIGTRNRAGYSLLTSHGFRPARQVYLMRCDAAPPEASAPDGVAFGASRTSDAEAILSIYRQCGFADRSPDAMRAAMEDARHGHAVARRGERVIAFVELDTHWPRRPWVAFVGVPPDERARGLGSALVAWALREQLAKGAVAGQLMLSPANRTALRAYEKVGFRRFRLVDVLEKTL